jgi:hypothetical protein
VFDVADIQRADERSRKLVIVALIVVTVGGVVLWGVFEDWMIAVRSLPVEEAKQSLSKVFLLCIGIMILGVCVIGWYCWLIGGRVRQTLRFPPPGMKVVRDTIVLSGQAAAARGRLLKVLGLILMFCAMALGVMSWWVLNMLRSVLG